MAEEQAMFKFVDLKVNSRDDRRTQNDNQSALALAQA